MQVAVPPTLDGSFTEPQREEIGEVAEAEDISYEESSRRHKLREAMEPAIRAISADPNNFGGLSLDDSGGTWRLHIYYVGDNMGRARVESLLPANMPVEWTKVKNNYATLERTHAALREMANGLGRPAFNFIRTDVWNNRIVASLRLGEQALAD